jgi:galactokinase
VQDDKWRGYVANMTPSVWRARFRERVPETLDGRSFLDRYDGITDPVTHVDPNRTYAVRACTEHPIDEHHRVRLFHALLDGGARSEAQRELLGELMYESHASYGACGLGSDGTDWLVERIRDVGTAAGLYGAKITGGGSGGTVAVLARAGCRPTLERVVTEYERESGRKGAIFGGSSPGALDYPIRTLVSGESTTG